MQIHLKVVKPEEVFIDVNRKQKLMRGIISDLHPLGNKSNSAIVIAFNEASFAHQIRETVRKNVGLKLGKIKVLLHLPPILDCKHNAALLARKEMLEEARRLGQPRKVHCNVTLSPPWIQLVEVKPQGGKGPIQFVVEDGRLVDPADTLATLALRGEKFVPFKILTPAQKAEVMRNVMCPATPLLPPSAPITNPLGASTSSAHANDIHMPTT